MDWVHSAIEYLRDNWMRVATNLGMAVIIVVATLAVSRFLGGWAHGALTRRSPRSATLAGIAQTCVKLSVLGMGVIMALDQLGENVAAILAGAGILGLAIGFGSQSLVKDVVSGFFLIFDESLAEGDFASVGGEATGTVERVGLRMTKIRSFNGQLWYVQNGEITRVGN
jgi:small conductance mechanosensitive channel